MMTDSVVSNLLQNWANIATVLCGLAALVAIVVALHSNKIAKNSNAIAANALRLQEDEGRVRLVVKPHIYFNLTDPEDQTYKNALPAVEVINLSAFPVTVKSICWRTTLSSGRYFYWKCPKFFSPSQDLPLRLPPRESFIAYMQQEDLRPEQLAAITGGAVGTACGEIFEGTTDDFQREIVRLALERAAEPD